MSENFLFLFKFSRFSQKFTAISPFIFPFFFITIYLSFTFFFFKDIFLLFFCLPLTNNSLRYDWAMAADNKSEINFLSLDEDVRFIDKAIFSNVFKYVSSHNNIKFLKISSLNFSFNLNFKCEFVKDIDDFFLTSRDNFLIFFNLILFLVEIFEFCHLIF